MIDEVKTEIHRYRMKRIVLRAAVMSGLLWLVFGWNLPACAETVVATRPVLLIDGDTVEIDGVRIRLLGIDTPETFRSRCEAELVLGLKAKERLRQLLDSGAVTYESHGFDRYGRTLARVYVGSVDVSQVLLDEGFALPYRPGGAAKLARLRAWCGRPRRWLPHSATGCQTCSAVTLTLGGWR